MMEPRTPLRAAVAGPVLFVLVFMVDSAVRPDYEPLRDSVSEAAIGPGG
jgi:hypothetical protein